MNSGSEKKLSMDELMERNRPAHTTQNTQTTPSEEAAVATPLLPTETATQARDGCKRVPLRRQG